MNDIIENARPSVAAQGQAAGNGLETGDSHRNCTTDCPAGQVAISDFLSCGQENALSLRHLEKIMELDGREIRRMIQSERKNGIPILADNATGYFLPGNEDERRRCVRSMRHRAHEILVAAQAIEDAEIRQPYMQEAKRAVDHTSGQMRLEGM